MNTTFLAPGTAVMITLPDGRIVTGRVARGVNCGTAMRPDWYICLQEPPLSWRQAEGGQWRLGDERDRR